ncbi:MAG: NADP-dependent oxidoreductase [Sphingobacteriaceae bacterium]|nr:MAG: NADP-dependent oxidoreductase [Sphingobacteriaceae bacterium]
MKAIIINAFGGTDKLELTDVPVPASKDNEVLIENRAISINPVDVRTRAGSAMAGALEQYMPLILGWDIAGTIVETGKAVTQFKKGDAVFGLVNFLGHGKGYAEYVAAPADQLALKPAGVSFEQAAAATLSALTAWQLLHHYAQVKKGDKVLIQAASGGVGHYAVQLAKYLGAHVTGVSSSKNREFVLGLGADSHIAYDEQAFEDVVKDADVVMDAFAFDSLSRSVEATRPGGKIISLLPMISAEVKQKAQDKNIDLHYELVHSSGEDMKVLADLMAKGLLRSHIDQVFAFEQMAQAHAAVETGKTVGKIVVKLPSKI